MATNVYGIITDRIVQALERGVAPWRKPWGGPDGIPRSACSRKPYRGINAFMLSVASGFDSPYWITYRQAQMWGGQVRKGEHGLPVCYWGKFEKKDKETGEIEASGIPFLKYFTVFNVEQCDGLPPQVVEKPQPRCDFQPLAQCAAIVDHLPDNRPTIEHGGNRACYFPAADKVQMPRGEYFDSPEHYYGTLFHELTHATGHASRLNRGGITDMAAFGSPVYSREELIAEMGAAFLCGHAGIDTPPLAENMTAYLAGWLKVLKADSKLLVQAASAAQKAADWILGTSPTAEEAAGV